tara:strand:- start:860 stop:1969 length:1110 start_codon:yes stop_codon:yes gene_type:complete
MKIPFVDLKAQYSSIKEEIDNSISNVIEDTAFIRGEYVERFEKDFAEKYGVKHVVSCGNGTDAIYISLKSLGIGIGDEVITTSSSWISTSETISQTGARVVFADIEPDYYSIDPKIIEKKITKNTKAIIPVHLYGHPANMTEIIKIADDYGLYIIEDCAQAHFATWQNKNVGTFGIAGTFSFYPGKNLGAYGDAGCIITNDDSFANKIRMYANHGAIKKHSHKIEGINSRMDGMQASILSSKLKHIDKWTKLRSKNAKLYNDLLSSTSQIVRPLTYSSATHVHHLYVIRTKWRDDLAKYLNINNISTGIHYPNPLPFLDAYRYLSHKPKDFPVSFSMKNEILSLPMYPELQNEEIEFVVDNINNFFKNK